jgi:hypothetical protein
VRSDLYPRVNGWTRAGCPVADVDVDVDVDVNVNVNVDVDEVAAAGAVAGLNATACGAYLPQRSASL